jgi:hypothetical protein
MIINHKVADYHPHSLADNNLHRSNDPARQRQNSNVNSPLVAALLCLQAFALRVRPLVNQVDLSIT